MIERPTSRTSLELRLEVEELYAAYVEAIDEDELERWPELFVAEKPWYRLVSRENWDRKLPLSIMSCESHGMLRDRVVAIRETQVYAPRRVRHFLSSLVVEQSDDGSIAARANVLLMQCLLNELPQPVCTGRYLDRIVRVDGTLRFQEKVCVIDSSLVPNSIIYPI